MRCGTSSGRIIDLFDWLIDRIDLLIDFPVTTNKPGTLCMMRRKLLAPLYKWTIQVDLLIDFAINFLIETIN